MLFLISTSCRELVCIHLLGPRVRPCRTERSAAAIAKSTRDGLWCNNGKSLKLLLMNQVGGDMAMLPGNARLGSVVDYQSSY